MKLPINETPTVITYADLSYMNAILENIEILRIQIINRMSYSWENSELEKVVFDGEYVRVFDSLSEESFEGELKRLCCVNDEIIIKVDWFVNYVSLFISEGMENSENSDGFALTRYGFYIKDKIYEFKEKKHKWIKLVRNGIELNFFTSFNGYEWDILYHTVPAWLSKSTSVNIGVKYSLESIQFSTWKYMNYMQLYLNTYSVGKRWLDYFMYPRKGYDHLYGAFNHFIDTDYHEYDEVRDIYGSIGNFIHYSIDRGYYVLMRLNEYYVPERKAYHVIQYEHDNLFYGYNEESYHILGYNVKMISSELPIDSLEDCCFFHNTKIFRHKFNLNEKKLDYNINHLIEAIFEYKEGINSSNKFSHVLAQEKGVYGLNVFHTLLNENKGRELLLRDERISYILYEHCAIMKERLVFLFKHNYLNELCEDQLLIKCEDMLNKSVILKNLFVKNIISGNLEDRILKTTESLYQQEKDFYENLYIALTKTRNKDG